MENNPPAGNDPQQTNFPSEIQDSAWGGGHKIAKDF